MGRCRGCRVADDSCEHPRDSLCDERLEQRRRVRCTAAAGIVLGIRQHDGPAGENRTPGDFARCAIDAMDVQRKLPFAPQDQLCRTLDRCVQLPGIRSVTEDRRPAFRDIGFEALCAGGFHHSR